MKKLLLIIAISLMGLVTAEAQCHPAGDVVFDSQISIDAFIILYPNCTKIDGNVTIEGADIWNFYGLSKITEITGDLIIKNNPALPFFSWLENLTTIGGGLIVQENANLVSFQGLSGLQTVDSIEVYKNPELINFAGTEAGHEGLSSLSSVGKDMIIWDNDKLISFEGLCELKTIGGDFEIGGLFDGNDKLKDFKGANSINPALGKLSSIGGDLDIVGNKVLTSLAGLKIVKSVAGNLFITSNPKLKTLEELKSVISIGGDLDILYCDELISLEGLSNIKSIVRNIAVEHSGNLTSLSGLNNISYANGIIQINYNISLKSLAGLNNIKKVRGYMRVENNPVLESLSGLNSIDTINWYVSINSNANLKSLSGLDNVKYIGDDLIIWNNPELESFSGLNNIDTIKGEVSIKSNNKLVSFNGLNNAKYIGDLLIYENRFLKSFSGLNNINTINGCIYIGDNYKLKSLAELENVNKINGHLKIEYNPVLSDISGIRNIDPVTIKAKPYTSFPDLTIANNPQLSLCSISNICEVVNDASKIVEINNNAPGCTGKPEVCTHCTTTYPGNLVFTNQTQIDTFYIYYYNCTKIDGDVIIEGNDIWNFAGLNRINTITGNLTIQNNPILPILSWLDNLTYIGGDFLVQKNNALVSFEGLNGLKTIDGYFHVWNNNKLKEFKGAGTKPALGELTTVGKELYIFNNDELTSLAGLDNVTYIGGYLDIWDNNGLASLAGLNKVDSVGGSVYIADNDMLNSLTGLDNIKKIKGYLNIADNDVLNNISGISNIDPATISNADNTQPDLYITNNPQLSLCSVSNICELVNNKIVEIHDNFFGCNSGAEISTGCVTTYTGNLVFTSQAEIDAFYVYFQNCTKIDGSVTIEGANINNFFGLQNIETITGDLTIQNNPALPILSWLDNLTTIGGGLIIDNNVNLQSLKGLSSLKSIGKEFFIWNNYKLKEITGDGIKPALGKLTFVGGSMRLTNNTILTSFNGLDKITSLEGDLEIIGNHKIESLSGLNGITYVSGELNIESNSRLKSFDGLNNIDSVGNELNIWLNPALESVFGLNKITSIGGKLFIDQNPELISLSGLEKVTSIGGDIIIGATDKLTSLYGLDNVKKINGYIYIVDNELLSDISGIRNIDPATVKSLNQQSYKDLNIFNNPQLSECAMDLCQFLTYPGLTTDIHDNGNLCSDATVMKDACTPPACTQLTDPANGTIDVKTNSNITWAAVTGAAGYWLTVGTTSDGTDIADADMQQATTWDPPSDFEGGVTIYVTVMPYNWAGLLANCSEESFTVEAVATGIKDTENGSGIKLYPNPARNTLYLSYDKDAVSYPKSIRIEIYSATGQKVIVINHLTDKIDISGLCKGIYLINFVTDKGTTTRKFAVAR